MVELRDLKPVRFNDVLRDVFQLPIEYVLNEESITALCQKLPDENLARLAEIREELENRERQYGIVYYEPQEYIVDGKDVYQRAFHASQKDVRLVEGGNQSGKSNAASVEGIWRSLGIHPFIENRVPNRGRVVATDLSKGIGENITQQYDKYLPLSEIRKIARYPGGELKKIYYNNNSTTDFMSYEQDSKLLEGWQGDWVQFDEPPPREHYIACKRGLIRRKGVLWLAMTPLDQPWIYDEIFTQGGPSGDKPDVFVWDILYNRFLDPVWVKKFMDTLTPDEIESRIHGRHRHLTGLIYKAFKPGVHTVKSFPIPPEWTRYCAMDYHPRAACTITWIAVDPHGFCYVYDELEIDKTVKEISEVIQGKEGTDQVRIRFIDPLSATPDRISGSCAQREFLRYKLAFRSATKAWNVGKNAVDQALRLDKEGHPGIVFFEDKVPKNINAMLHYQWDDYNDSEDGLKEKPKKKWAHFPDTVRYIMVMRPNYRATDDKENKLTQLTRPQPTGGHKYTGYSFGGSK